MVDWIKDGVSEEKKLFVDMASTRILGSYLMFIQAVPKMAPKLVATPQQVELIKNGLFPMFLVVILEGLGKSNAIANVNQTKKNSNMNALKCIRSFCFLKFQMNKNKSTIISNLALFILPMDNV